MRLEVGTIDKAHGVSGDVIVTLLTDRVERLAPGSVLTSDNGTYTVTSSQPHQHRFLVNFAEIDDRNAADGARGTALYGEPIEDPDVLWVHDLVGASVIDTTGASLGTVESVEANPASDLLVLADGGLVPLTFLVEHRDDGVLVVDPPAGLFEALDASSDKS